jgi:hypothetical protein
MSLRIVNNFLNLVKTKGFDTLRYALHNLPDATRTGKTFDVIMEMMPYVIQNTNQKWLILTCPLNGIIKEKEVYLRQMVSQHTGATYVNDYETIKRSLDAGLTVVTYITNAKAYSNHRMLNFIKTIDVSKIAIWADEIDYGGVSHASLMEEVKGYKADPDRYKATFYTTMLEISKHTAWCFSFTATESFEFLGLVKQYGKLQYVSVNPLKEGEQKVHAPYVAHYGGCHFFENGQKNHQNLVAEDKTDSTIELMLKKNLIIETHTNLKRAIIIGCGMDSSELDEQGNRVQHGTAPNPDSVIKMLVKHNQYLIGIFKDRVEGCVLTGEYSYTFNKWGEILDENLNEWDVQERINDLTDPLKILLVKSMGGRGVTFRPVKDVMLLKSGDAQTPHGQSTESPHQFATRGKTVYVGPAHSKFWTTYNKDVRNVPGYNQLANTYNLYLPNTKRMRETEETHRKFDACTSDMLEQKYLDICGECGSILSNNKQGSLKLSENEENLINKLLNNELVH